MRIFEPLDELELYDGERLIGIYVPGLRYNCLDDDVHVVLAKTLDQWLVEGKARIIEDREGTGPASAFGQGEIK